MRVDLLAGTVYVPAGMPAPSPTILVFDSGLGGLTVLPHLQQARPDARFVYAADDAAFPYGALSEEDLVTRVLAVFERLIGRYRPDLAVIACHTASTLVLPPLRRRFGIPFVGTVPAIKPAVAATRSGLVSVLATPGTVARDYTRDLIDTYAGDCRVTLVGSRQLAAIATAALSGEPVDDEAIRAEMAPAFVEEGGRRTDTVVLGCTHYPLLLPQFQRLAPWPVTWIDPAAAIARRVVQLIGPAPAPETSGEEAVAVFTAGTMTPALRDTLLRRGLGTVAVEPMPLARA